jgi:hypothetical protein
MRSDALTLEHPIERLELFELNAALWNALNPPELYIVDNTALVPLRAIYMPDVLFVEIENKAPIEMFVNHLVHYTFRLNCSVPDEWISFFNRRCGEIDATAHKRSLTLRCGPRDLEEYSGRIRHAVHQATKDYRQEREILVGRVYEKMKRLEAGGAQ